MFLRISSNYKYFLFGLILLLTYSDAFNQIYPALEQDFISVKKALSKKRFKEPYSLPRASNQIVKTKYDLLSSDLILDIDNKTKDYLNKIVAELLKEQFTNIKDSVNINIIKSSEKNAFVIFDGSIFITTALISYLPNEISLKYIIGHEIAHYIHEDICESLYDEYYNLYDLPFYEKRKMLTELSKKRELRADSLSISFLKNFDKSELTGIVNTLDLFKERKDLRVLRSGKSKIQLEFEGIHEEIEENFWGTHPGTDQRKKILLSKKTSISSQNNDKDNFLALKMQTNTLSYLFEKQHYESCILESFIQYLTQPYIDETVFFILESMRRLIMIHPDLVEKPFLLEKTKAKIDFDAGIINNLNYITTNKIVIELINRENVIKENITTYEDAFAYFARIAHSTSNKNALFSIGIHYQDTSILEDYVKSNGKYKEFTLGYLKGDLTFHKNKTLKIISPIREYTLNTDESTSYHFVKTMTKSKKTYDNFIKQHSLTPEETKYSEELSNHQRSVLYNHIESIDNLLDLKSEPTPLPNLYFLFSPEIWNIFNTEGIDKVEVLDIKRITNLRRCKYQSTLTIMDLSKNVVVKKDHFENKWKPDKPERLESQLIKILE
tara:strand:+ start:1086 stop:2915 length:1830 start_codon:yes stop_codon:yes gene_type:complete